MNYYGYSGKKSKHRSNKRTVIIRIAIIVFAVVGSIAFGLILGNHLKNKLDTTEVSREPVEDIIPDTVDPVEEEPELTFKTSASFEELSLLGGYLDLKDCPDEKSAEAFVTGLKNGGYTGIIFDVKDENGKLTYTSAAVSSLAGAVTSGSVTSDTVLSAAVSSASAQGMKRCAYIELSDVLGDGEENAVSAVIDRRVIGELARLGFDRFILDGVFNGKEFSSDPVNDFYGYMETLREAAPDAYFGIVLEPSVFEASELTPTLELLFRYTDFFAVNFSDSSTYSDQAVETFRDNFSGSMSAYRITVLLDGAREGDIVRRCEMFSLSGTNVSFLTPRTDYKTEKDEDGRFLYSSKLPDYSVFKEAEDTEAD